MIDAPLPDNKALGGDGYDNLFANEGPSTQKFYGEGGDDVLQTGAGDDLLDGGNRPSFTLVANEAIYWRAA